jgi:hypothetical protein
MKLLIFALVLIAVIALVTGGMLFIWLMIDKFNEE